VLRFVERGGIPLICGYAECHIVHIGYYALQHLLVCHHLLTLGRKDARNFETTSTPGFPASLRLEISVNGQPNLFLHSDKPDVVQPEFQIAVFPLYQRNFLDGQIDIQMFQWD
jgi:hypothetical protein